MASDNVPLTDLLNICRSPPPVWHIPMIPIVPVQKLYWNEVQIKNGLQINTSVLLK